MMAANSEIVANLAKHPGFNLRCQLVATQFAINFVLGEDPATANHINRVALASKVIGDKVPAELLARVVLTDGNIQAAALADAGNAGAAVADVNIDGRLQAMWNNLANAAL